MNNETHDIELIERYFDNELTDRETAKFIERLKTDQELKKLFDREKLLINTIRYDATNSNLQFLKKLEESFSQQGKQRHFRSWYYYAAAASVILFIAVALYLPFAQQTHDELYADYFNPHPNVFEPVLRGESSQNKRTDAFRAYEEGDYAKAAQLFNELLNEKKEPGILLLAGNASLMLGKTNEAQKNLNDLITTYDELDIPAKWYLSLSYLKTNEVDQARILLKELAETENSYAAKAKELLNKVE